VRAKALVFEDPRSVEVLSRLRQIAPSEATVLVMGETGTGKEIVARHIHDLSQRGDRPFVAVNCGALADTLIESELFGHEKGAFTGAVSSKPGWFEAASGGTLFLDEVGDLPLGMQVKLLRVLQESEVVRVGARQPIRVDVRLIAATNVSLQQAVAAGHFREDLFYRLNVAPLVLPPLRERPGDILPLVEYFTAFYQQRLGIPAPTLSEQAVQRLLQHSWPGNIRELENAVHHALLVCQDGYVTPKDLQLSSLPARASRPPERAPDEPVTPESALANGLDRLFEAGVPDLWDAIERAVMSRAFEFCERNQLQTARLLGISRNIVRARLIEYGQIPGSVRGAAAAPSATIVPQAPRVLRPTVPCVRIGYQRIGLLPLVKQHGGLDTALKARGYRVEWIEYPGGIQMVEAFQASQLSFAGVGEGPPVFAQAARVPMVYIAAEAPAPTDEALVVPVASAVRSVSELAGKRIALNRGANVHYLLIRALEEAGLDYEDVEVVYLTPAEARVAFELGHVDAWAIWAPLLHELVATSAARVLRDASGLADNTVVYIGSESLVEQNPELVHLFFNELAAVAATAAPHRFPRRVDERLLAEQQTVADTFHRHNLLGRAVRIHGARSAPARQAVGATPFA
jgi:DNA-binding NtrC family response regulator/ABC-type nitrate/sulfonate/bicarbonate transport system substrate-binding protein